MSVRIELEMVVLAPIERVFDLTRSVEVHLASAKDTEERPVGGKTSGLLELGDEITWRARHFGVVQELTSRMTAFDRPNHFRDSMVRGAFTRFDHDHFFDATPDGTRCRDVFDFDAPLGPLGWIAERLLLERHMRLFLEERARHIKHVAEGDEWRRFV